MTESLAGDESAIPLAVPAVILVEPQMGENIGAAARAMANCGLQDLRLVNPRDGWPNVIAERAAVGAFDLLDPVRLFSSTKDALYDLTLVYATTARDRRMVKPILTPRSAALAARAHLAQGGRAGLLFGPERMGLVNDDLSLADALVTVPLNPAFNSLNLGQAVLLMGYEWLMAGDATPSEHTPFNGALPASKEELHNFFAHLERELDACGFLRNEEARPNMVRNLRNMWQRAQLTDQEIRTLHGVVKELSTLRESRAKRDREGGQDT
jgi:tRNA/rRNA methyltransferase